MCHMRRSNLVMQEVDQSPRIQLIVWTVNGMEGSLDVVVILVAKMRHIDIGVLQPCVYNQPGVHDKVWTSVDSHHLSWSIADGPGNHSRQHSSNSDIALVHFLLPLSRKQLLNVLLWLQWLWVVVIGQPTSLSSARTNHQIGRPPNDQVQKGLQNSPCYSSFVFSKFFNKFVPCLQRIRLPWRRSSLGNMCFSQFNIVCVLVMNRVGVLP
mmetsp:Transcript_25938/g.44126  ORF Transcript_25938/g.44126 Transcript_25938/m.44126 type:complete len:210 (-) Transcript_25938:589-1218(-)